MTNNYGKDIDVNWDDYEFDDVPSDIEAPGNVTWEQQQGRKYVFHCKPCVNYQSVEFDFEGTEESIEYMFKIYDRIYKGLLAIAGEQKIDPKDLATDKQKAIMDKFKIKYSATTTKEEAQGLIQKSIDYMNGK